MPTVYLKARNTAKVSLTELENYLYENQQHIEIRRRKLGRDISKSVSIQISDRYLILPTPSQTLIDDF